MCEKCVRAGKKSHMKRGKVNFLAHRFLNGEPIPLFFKRSDNLAVEGRLFQLMRRQSNKKFYSRKGRKHECL